ncbi:MAG: transposase [Anaerolineaceae bacterium]|nr:transposase [Anaerolineaceae bacterium]MBR6090993.1 transposase [Anaerolineaceae bacterium]
METDKDHTNIMLEYDATERICDIISILKQQTTYSLWKQFPEFLLRQ